VGALTGLRDDEFFQDDLKDPDVRAAIDHWTGKQRLSNKEAQKRFNENYKVLQVLEKLKRLQHACREAKIAVPLAALLAGKTDPFYGVETKKKTGETGDGETAIGGSVEKEKVEQVGIEQVRENPTDDSPPEFPALGPGAEKEEESFIDTLLELSPKNVARWWTVEIVLLSIYMYSK